MTNKQHSIKWNGYSGKIICGDVLDYLAGIREPFVDLIVTSPPYNVGIKYDSWNDAMPVEEYRSWMGKVVKELLRITKRGGRLCINVPFIGNTWFRAKSTKMQFYPAFYLPLIEEVGWIPRDFFVWIKTRQPENPNSFCGNATSWGSWLSPSCPYARCFAEVILVFHKETKKLQEKGETDLTKSEFLELTKNVWYFPAEISRQHPAPFPVELPRRLIKLYSYVGATVLDPFCGSGATCVAARMLKRNFVGVDISEKYCKQAFEAVAQATLQWEKDRGSSTSNSNTTMGGS